MHRERMKKGDTNTIIDAFITKLKKYIDIDFDNFLPKMFCEDKNSNIECIYILNMEGIQISDTLFINKVKDKRKALMFYPAKKASDHSMKRYYCELVYSNLYKYISDPYISNATGNICTTISTTYKNDIGENYIFCVDLIYG